MLDTEVAATRISIVRKIMAIQGVGAGILGKCRLIDVVLLRKNYFNARNRLYSSQEEICAVYEKNLTTRSIFPSYFFFIHHWRHHTGIKFNIMYYGHSIQYEYILSPILGLKICVEKRRKRRENSILLVRDILECASNSGL